ncbi:MAG TPA: amidohydrolase family protein [Steroidobacteraceae bacterium]
MSDAPLFSLPLRPPETISRPTFRLPAGAWDVHVHIFGPAERYSHVEKPHYTLPDGTLAQYRNLMPRLGIEKFVIVQPSFYGCDNSCLLDTLDEIGDRARGVVMIGPDITDAELDGFHRRGVRAVRLDLFKRAREPVAAIKTYIKHIAARVSPLGWHLQFYAPGYVVRDLIPFFRTLPLDLVIDHMGYMLEEDGLRSTDFSALLDLLGAGHCFLKLSGAYRIAKLRGYEYVEPVAKAIVERAAERALWGSDWPHISYSDRDTGELLSLLERWAPSESARHKILVENPNRLFGIA